MGIRISTSIGYALTMSDLLRYSPVAAEAEHGWEGDGVYNHMRKFGPAELTVPYEVARDSFNDRSTYTIFERHILAHEYVGPGDEPSAFATADSLFQFVHTPDETTHIIFYPTASVAKRWHRYDDDIDYAFSTANGEMTNDVTFHPFGFYPYANNIWKTGTMEVVPWPGCGHPDLTNGAIQPAPPQELTWWLQRTGLLTDEGIIALRPIRARWWS